AWMSLNVSSTAYWMSYGPRRPSAIRLAEAIVHERTDLPRLRASARFVRFPLGEPAQASFVEPGLPAPVHPGIDRPLVGEHTPRTGTTSASPRPVWISQGLSRPVLQDGLQSD